MVVNAANCVLLLVLKREGVEVEAPSLTGSNYGDGAIFVIGNRKAPKYVTNETKMFMALTTRMCLCNLQYSRIPLNLIAGNFQQSYLNFSLRMNIAGNERLNNGGKAKTGNCSVILCVRRVSLKSLRGKRLKNSPFLLCCSIHFQTDHSHF